MLSPTPASHGARNCCPLKLDWAFFKLRTLPHPCREKRSLRTSAAHAVHRFPEAFRAWFTRMASSNIGTKRKKSVLSKESHIPLVLVQRVSRLAPLGYQCVGTGLPRGNPSAELGNCSSNRFDFCMQQHLSASVICHRLVRSMQTN